jgi:hypothetical protein
MTIPCRPSAQWCGNCLDPCPDHDFHALYMIPTQVRQLCSASPVCQRTLALHHPCDASCRLVTAPAMRCDRLVGVPGRLAFPPGSAANKPPPSRGSRRATAQRFDKQRLSIHVVSRLPPTYLSNVSNTRTERTSAFSLDSPAAEGGKPGQTRGKRRLVEEVPDHPPRTALPVVRSVDDAAPGRSRREAGAPLVSSWPLGD